MILGKLLGWFLQGWTQAAATAILATLIAFPLGQCSGHSAGVKAEKRSEAARLESARKKVAKRDGRARVVTDNVAAKLTKARVEIRYRTKYLVKEVPTYVTPASDDRCTVPLGFVRLHDAAAQGGSPGLPAAAGGPLDAPSGVQLSTVLETVVGNYGAAYDWRAEALNWREWYVKQKAEWERRG